MLGSVRIMAQKTKRRLLPACALALALGCGGNSGNSQNPDVAAPTPDAESTQDGGVDSGTSSESGAVRTLSGAVTDQAGVPVVGAKVQVGTLSVFSDGQGLYTLAGVDRSIDGGRSLLVVTRDWFKPSEVEVDVNESGNTHYDITLEEKPLLLDPADVAVANAYNLTFEWSRQKLSIAIAAPATRRNFDNAVYWQNPALYHDTSSIAPLVPSPAPQIVGGVPANLSFPIRGGANDGKEALDLTSVVDSIAGTPVAAMATTDYMLWTPMLNWLTDWDPAKSADLKMAGVAVRQQNWGSNVQRPQEIQRVYLDRANGVLWVEVVFAKFVQLGDGITDDDGDSYKEIFAKIDTRYASQEILDKLVGYGQTRYGTYGMSKEVTKALREIYSTTSAVVERYIGQPFDIPGLGTIQYPFVVLKHAGGQENVILVGP
jgi:hypothetical protein